MAKMTKEERADREGAAVNLALPIGCWSIHNVGMFIVNEQDRREGPLVEALRLIAAASQCGSPHCCCKSCRARKAISAWEALDSKPEPTLLEAAKDARMVCSTCITGPPNSSHVRIPLDKWEAIVAAVEREEGK